RGGMRLQVSSLLALLLFHELEKSCGVLLPEVAMHLGSELLLAEQFLLASKPGEANAHFRSAHLKVEDEAGEGISDGLLHLPSLCEQGTQLTLGEGHAGTVAQRLLDLKRAQVLPLRLLVVSLAMGQHAQLVVAGGHAGLFAQRLLDLEGAQVLPLRLLV